MTQQPNERLKWSLRRLPFVTKVTWGASAALFLLGTGASFWKGFSTMKLQIENAKQMAQARRAQGDDPRGDGELRRSDLKVKTRCKSSPFSLRDTAIGAYFPAMTTRDEQLITDSLQWGLVSLLPWHYLAWKHSVYSKPAVLRSFTLLLSATVGIGWAVNYLRDFANEYSDWTEDRVEVPLIGEVRLPFHRTQAFLFCAMIGALLSPGHAFGATIYSTTRDTTYLLGLYYAIKQAFPDTTGKRRTPKPPQQQQQQQQQQQM